MPKCLRIATWNVKRPRKGGWKNNPHIRSKINEINADIWVLTETNSVISPDTGYTSIASPSIEGYHRSGENCTTIWSRYPIKQQSATFDPTFAICAEIESPVGNLLIYGTIITYAHDKGSAGTSKQWEEHYKSIQAHGEDWQKLSQGLPFCVAGDFNETLSGATRYGTAKGRAMLKYQLERNNLICVTEKYNIDHICLNADWAKRVNNVSTWQAYNSDNKPVSDHQGISIDLFFQ